MTVRAGIIYFAPNSNDVCNKMVGIAIFESGQCVSVLFNECLLKKYMQESFGNLYIMPEYLNHVVAGMQESFWDMFLARANTFVKFAPTAYYTVDQIKEETIKLLQIQKTLENG